MDAKHGTAELGTERLTAIHEAGHAVVASLLGLTVSHLEIVGNPRELGSCHTLRLPKGKPVAHEHALEDALLVSCAGIVAESLERGDGGWDECSPDLNQAVHLALELTGDCEGAHALLLRTRRRLRRALSRHWDRVEALAAALISAKRLDRREVEAILNPILYPPPERARRLRGWRYSLDVAPPGTLEPQGQH